MNLNASSESIDTSNYVVPRYVTSSSCSCKRIFIIRLRSKCQHSTGAAPLCIKEGFCRSEGCFKYTKCIAELSPFHAFKCIPAHRKCIRSRHRHTSFMVNYKEISDGFHIALENNKLLLTCNDHMFDNYALWRYGISHHDQHQFVMLLLNNPIML